MALMMARADPGPARHAVATGDRADQPGLSSSVDAILHRWPAVGLAVGVVRNGRLDAFEGRGLADVRLRRPVTPETVFRIGSITKTFTSIAVMQLWERGLVDLDAPAGDYLRAYPLVSRDRRFRPPTIRHLLTHTAGIPDVRHLSDLFAFAAGPIDARPPLLSVPFGDRLPPLAEYYGKGLEIVADPGCAFAYSNHGFATLGQIVEDVSGLPLDRYLRERIFLPLGMSTTDLIRSPAITERLATGYLIGSAGPVPVPDRDWIGAGGGGAYSTAADLARYALALMNGGSNEHGSVLERATLEEMFDRQYATDAALPAMGLGFFRTEVGGHRVIGHDGILPGFNSHLSVAPEAGVAVIGLTNGSSGAMRWLPGEMDGLLRGVLRAPSQEPRPALPHHPESWGEIVGRYVLPPRISDLRGRLVMGRGVEVFVHGGRPMLRVRLPVPAVWRGLPLEPDDPADPRAFRLDLARFGMGEVRLRFRRDPVSGRKVMHTDLGNQPISFEVAAGGSHAIPRRVVVAAAAIAGAVALARSRRARVGPRPSRRSRS